MDNRNFALTASTERNKFPQVTRPQASVTGFHTAVEELPVQTSLSPCKGFHLIRQQHGDKFFLVIEPSFLENVYINLVLYKYFLIIIFIIITVKMNKIDGVICNILAVQIYFYSVPI